jgi:hypothetical protein
LGELFATLSWAIGLGNLVGLGLLVAGLVSAGPAMDPPPADPAGRTRAW